MALTRLLLSSRLSENLWARGLLRGLSSPPGKPGGGNKGVKDDLPSKDKNGKEGGCSLTGGPKDVLPSVKQTQGVKGTQAQKENKGCKDTMPPAKQNKVVKSCSSPVKIAGSTISVEPKSKHLGAVVCAWETNGAEEFMLSSWGKDLDKKSNGKITKLLKELVTDFPLGHALVVNDILPESYRGVAIASVGRYVGYNVQEDLDENRENSRIGTGAALRALREFNITQVDVDPCDTPDAVCEAQQLSKWRFDPFKPYDIDSAPALNEADESEHDSTKGYDRGEAQNWARYLCEMPPNLMTPTGFATQAQKMLKKVGVSVEVHHRDWIVKKDMKALLMAANGSVQPPIVLECVYKGTDPDVPSVLLTAEGITFDSGGLCLKTQKELLAGRGISISGAAVAVAALWGLAKTKAEVNVACVIPLCENMVSGACLKVGEDITMYERLTVKVGSTDMENHLLSATALTYGTEVYNPWLTVNVAALTSSVESATGGGAFACFTNSDEMWTQMQHAGALTGDRAWRLPLWSYYFSQLYDGNSVKLQKTGTDKATPSLSAAFLQHFVKGPFVHLDISGVGRLADAAQPPYLDPGYMTGRPTRTLIEFITNAG